VVFAEADVSADRRGACAVAVYIVRNPDKLRHVADTVH